MKYELSRKLTKSEQASLDSARAGLSKALDGIALALKTAGEDEKKLADLLSRESALEVEADRGSEDASLKLAGVKDQVTRLRRALANPPGGGAGGALNHEVLQASGLLQTVVVGDVQRQIEDLIEARNGDFFFDRTRARGVAFGCDALQVLRNTFTAAPETVVPGRVSEGERFLRAVDALLAGGAIWEFPPAPKKGR